MASGVFVTCHKIMLFSTFSHPYFGSSFWRPLNLTFLAHWTRTWLGKTQKIHCQTICQVTHEQKQDWVALWNKPIWILLSPEHLVSLILWKVSMLSIRARLECWSVSALDDNWMQQLELEEGDALPSAVQKERRLEGVKGVAFTT